MTGARHGMCELVFTKPMASLIERHSFYFSSEPKVDSLLGSTVCAMLTGPELPYRRTERQPAGHITTPFGNFSFLLTYS
jgi:hypothetical protein